MNVSLTGELERFIADKVDSGLYSSASEVVREALRLLKAADTAQRPTRADLIQAIERGWDERDTSPAVPAKTVLDDLRQRTDTRRRPQRTRRA